MAANIHNRFCISVIELAKCYAEMTRLKNKVVDGEAVTDKEIYSLKSLSRNLSSLIVEVEHLENLLGYQSVGFPFMADANFNGFAIKNGELEGDVQNAYLVAEPWFCDFVSEEKTSESDCFKFFVAAFITYMADMYYPNVLEEVRRRAAGRRIA